MVEWTAIARWPSRRALLIILAGRFHPRKQPFRDLWSQHDEACLMIWISVEGTIVSSGVIPRWCQKNDSVRCGASENQLLVLPGTTGSKNKDGASKMVRSLS
jgi:hypothetical protein